VLSPRNCQTVKFNFITYKSAKFVGKRMKDVFKPNPKKQDFTVSKEIFDEIAK